MADPQINVTTGEVEITGKGPIHVAFTVTLTTEAAPVTRTGVATLVWDTLRQRWGRFGEPECAYWLDDETNYWRLGHPLGDEILDAIEDACSRAVAEHKG